MPGDVESEIGKKEVNDTPRGDADPADGTHPTGRIVLSDDRSDRIPAVTSEDVMGRASGLRAAARDSSSGQCNFGSSNSVAEVLPIVSAHMTTHSVPRSRNLQIGVPITECLKPVCTSLLRGVVALNSGGSPHCGRTRIGPPKGADCHELPLHYMKALPPIEAVTAGALTPANGESDEPQDENHGRRYPQQMHGEPGSKRIKTSNNARISTIESTSLFDEAPRFAAT